MLQYFFRSTCLGLIAAGIFLISCSAFKSQRPAPETWQDAPDRTTTKIRLVTHMDKNALQEGLIMRVLRTGLSIDTVRSSPGHLYSTLGTVENYYVNFLVETKDSVATVSGQAGHTGLNGIGVPATISNVAWDPIVYNGKGWERLTVIARLPDARLQYNSMLRH